MLFRSREDEHGVMVRGAGDGTGGDGKEVGARVELEDAAVGEVAAEKMRQLWGGVGGEEVGEEEREERDRGGEVEPEGEDGDERERPRRRRPFSAGALGGGDGGIGRHRSAPGLERVVEWEKAVGYARESRVLSPPFGCAR